MMVKSKAIILLMVSGTLLGIACAPEEPSSDDENGNIGDGMGGGPSEDDESGANVSDNDDGGEYPDRWWVPAHCSPPPDEYIGAHMVARVELPEMRFHGVAATDGGDYFVSGSFYSEPAGVGVMRVSTTGEVAWAERLLDHVPFDDMGYGGAVSLWAPIVGADGRLFLFGQTPGQHYGAVKQSSGYAQDYFYAEVDPDGGELLWFYQFGENDDLRDLEVHDVAADGEGHLYLSLSANRETQIVRTGKEGTLEVVYTPEHYAPRLAALSDGTLFLVSSASDIVARLGADGDKKWEIAIPNGIGPYIAATEDGGLFVGSGRLAEDEPPHTWIARLRQQDGEVVWETTSTDFALDGFLKPHNAEHLFVRTKVFSSVRSHVIVVSGHLARFDGDDGSVKWTSALGDAVNSTTDTLLAPRNDAIYVTSAVDGCPVEVWPFRGSIFHR